MKQKFAAPRTADSLSAAVTHPIKGNRVPSGNRAILAVLALTILAAAFNVAPASAAVKPAVTVDPNPAAFYTTAEVSGTINPEGEECCGISWVFEYSTEPAVPSSWVQSTATGGIEYGQVLTTPQPAVGTMEGLKPDTTYYVRLSASMYPEPEASISGAPYPSFTTKHVNKSVATLNPVTGITLDSAHLSGSVYPNAPAGPLSPVEKAAYKTEWKIECSPGCPFNVPSENTVIEGDAPSQSFSIDPGRLETNTFYEVKLSATNGAGTTIAERSFRTPLILPGVKAAPGGSAGKGAFNVGGVVTPYNTKITDCHIAYGPTTEYVYKAPCSPNPVGRSEVQAIGLDYSGAPDTTFKILFRGQTTQDIVVGADASVVEEELKALSAIGPEGVTNVERIFGFFYVTYNIEFSGPLASTNIGPLRALLGKETAGTPGGNFAGTLVDGGNNKPVLVEAHLTGLTPGATYHYQVFATNSLGTGSSGDGTFVAPFAAEDELCPNEAVRIENNSTRLPECRAYELVTSAFKASSPATLAPGQPGEGAVGYSSRAGNINNSGSGYLFNGYQAYRTDDRWETVSNINGGRGSPYAPPYSLGEATAAHGVAGGHSVWYLKASPEQEHPEPYLRFPDGHFELIAHGDPGPTGADHFFGSGQDNSGRIHTLWTGGAGFFGATMFPVGLWEVIDTFRTNNGAAIRVDLDNSGNNTISGCNPPNTYSEAEPRKITDDARVIYFMAQPCEFDAGGLHQQQLWARVEGSKSYFASESHCTRTAGDPGGACNAPSTPETEDFATDGSRAFFRTDQQLVNADTNQKTDLYAYTLPTAADPTPELDLITGSSPDPRYGAILRASNDGSTVFFLAKGVLASNHDALDKPAFYGDENLYVWQKNAKHPDGETRFIGSIPSPGDLDYLSYFSEITPNGRYLLFMSTSTLVETDTDNAFDIYRYDADTGLLERVSTDTSGVGGNADGLSGYLPYNTGNRHDHPAMSSSGEEIVFTTAEALSADDGNGSYDVYLWKKGRTHLISSGAVGPNGEEGSAPPPFATALIDGSGTDIYFATEQAMTADDVDTVSDVYVARRGGGWSFAESAPCAGEACQPSAAIPTQAPAPASDRTDRKGNYRPATITIKALSSSQKAELAAGGRVGLKLKVSGPGEAAVKGTAQIGDGRKQVLTSKYSAVQAGQVQVPISLSGLAQAQLRGRGSLKIALSVTFADAVPTTSTVTLKAAGARPGHSKRKRG